MKRMLVTVGLLLALGNAAHAFQTHPCAPPPAFTAEGNYMTQEGNLRWQYARDHDGVWPTREEMERCFIITFLGVKVQTPSAEAIAIGDAFYKDLRQLCPYTAETNYMSISGYLRWLEMQNPTAGQSGGPPRCS